MDKSIINSNKDKIKGEKKMAVSKGILGCVKGKEGTKLIKDIESTKLNKDIFKECSSLLKLLAMDIKK